MRIESALLHQVQIPFRGSFGHALSSRSRSDAVFVQLRDEVGTVGWGEILPRPYVTGETIEGVMSGGGAAMAERFVGQTFDGPDALRRFVLDTLPAIGRSLATFGGFEVALCDVVGQRLGFSLASLLGGTPGPALPPGVIIGFEVATADLKKHCVGLRWNKHTHVKVKVGLDDDEARLTTIAKAMKVPLRLDANAAWSAAEAVQRLRALSHLPIASIEQPVAADDLAGLRMIREQTSVPVMADESVCSLADVERLIREEAADIFNVRPGKHGGVLASQAIVERAKQAQIGVHLGTLVGESGVLSRVAEVFGRCTSGFACLDGKGQNRFLLEADVLRPADSERSTLCEDLDAPGLGVIVDPDVIRLRRVGQAIML